MKPLEKISKVGSVLFCVYFYAVVIAHLPLSFVYHGLPTVVACQHACVPNVPNDEREYGL